MTCRRKADRVGGDRGLLHEMRDETGTGDETGVRTAGSGVADEDQHDRADHGSAKRSRQGGSRRGFAVSPAITQISRTGRTPSGQEALTCGFVPALEWLDARGRSLQPVPCRAQRGTQDQDRCVFRPVKSVLQGLFRRLTHPLTLPYLTSPPGTGPGSSRDLPIGSRPCGNPPHPAGDQEVEGRTTTPGAYQASLRTDCRMTSCVPSTTWSSPPRDSSRSRARRTAVRPSSS